MGTVVNGSPSILINLSRPYLTRISINSDLHITGETDASDRGFDNFSELRDTNLAREKYNVVWKMHFHIYSLTYLKDGECSQRFLIKINYFVKTLLYRYKHNVTYCIICIE